MFFGHGTTRHGALSSPAGLTLHWTLRVLTSGPTREVPKVGEMSEQTLHQRRFTSGK